MIEVTCVCDVCNRSKQVQKVKITKNGKVIFYMECGHVSGFVFDAKLLRILVAGAKK